MSGSSQHAFQGEDSEVVRALTAGLPPAKKSVAETTAEAQSAPAPEHVAEASAEEQLLLPLEDTAEGAVAPVPPTMEEMIAAAVAERVKPFDGRLRMQAVNMGKQKASLDAMQEMIGKITTGKADTDSAPVADNDTQAVEMTDPKAPKKFEKKHTKAIAHFIESFKDIYEFRQVDITKPHDGGTFWTNPTDGGAPVKAFSVRPAHVEIHAPNNDDVLKHSIILAVQMYGTDLKINNATPEMLDKMKQILADLHQSGELLDHKGKALSASAVFKINGVKLGAPVAINGSRRFQVLRDMASAMSRHKANASSPAESEPAGPVPSTMTASEVPQEPAMPAPQPTPETTSADQKTGSPVTAPHTNKQVPAEAQVMEAELAPDAPGTTHKPAGKAMAPA